MNFDAFARDCHSKLQQKQAELNAQYDVSGADHWYYQQAIPLLMLNWGETYRYFRYAEAGTFSEQTGTWLWAWDNHSILEPAKASSRNVQQLGVERRYEPLSDPHFESTEAEAWTLGAVATEVLDGLGLYRIKNEHLHSFLVLVAEVSVEDGDDMMANVIDCKAHDTQRVAFVCRHVFEQSENGFEEAFETQPGMWLENGEDLQAWCESCEAIRLADDGWNDGNMKTADIRLVCETCYFDFKERELGHR